MFFPNDFFSSFACNVYKAWCFSSVGWLKVEWDSDAHVIRWYRYGSTLSETDKYEVKVCDEPRILQNESIATGCLVVRGIYSYKLHNFECIS